MRTIKNNLVQLLSILVLLCGCNKSANTSREKINKDNYNFEITWGLPRSYYNSNNGQLVKSRDYIEHKPEDYITNYKLKDSERTAIYNSLISVDILSYPEQYNPYLEDKGSTEFADPSAGMIFSIDGYTISCPYFTTNKSHNPKNERGLSFVTSMQLIIYILVTTEEWKNLPDYEVWYI